MVYFKRAEFWHRTGARSAGKPHAACDVAGAGNGLTVRLVRHSHRKRGETDRPRLRSTAPALDPTDIHIHPATAYSDAQQTIDVETFSGIVKDIEILGALESIF